MRRALLISTVLTCSVHTTLHAQTVQAPAPSSPVTVSATTDQVAEVVVTAQKRQQSLSDVGLTVNVVSASDLAEKSITRSADLTRAVPGLTVAENSDGTPIYTLRGVSFNSVDFGSSPTVSVYVDEAPVPFSIMTEGALLDLDRVEVLKGPQGTLFGQNATGGAINYIAAKPTRDFEAGATGTYSRFDTTELSGYVSGPLTDTLLARLSVSGTTSGPWQQSVTRDAQLGDQNRAAARLLLDWRPVDHLRVSLNVNGWIDRSDTQAAQFVALHVINPATAYPGLLSTPLGTGSARDADWNPGLHYRRDNAFYQGVLRFDYDLNSHTTLTSLTDYSRVNIHSLSDLAANALPLEDQLATGRVSAISQEFRIAGVIPQAHIHYIAGVNYQGDKTYQSDLLNTNLSQSRDVFGSGLNVTTSAPIGRQSNETYAAFASGDWDITNKLALSGGIRQTYINHSSVTCYYDSGDGSFARIINTLDPILRSLAGLPAAPLVQPGGCTTIGPTFAPVTGAGSFSENNFAWRGNLNYKLQRDTLLYATVSRGFKAGNYPVVPATTYQSLAPVVQEELTSYEVGVKTQLFDRHLAFNVAGFYYDYRNKQLLSVADTALGPFLTVQNVPHSSVRGFDADLTWRPISGLTLRPTVTYADSKVGNVEGLNADDVTVSFTGHPFNLAPKWISVDDAEYRRALTDDLAGFIGATLTYNSKTYADLADSPELAIREFTTLDLRAGVSSRTGRWDLTVFGRNVTNLYHWNYAYTGGDAIIRYASFPVTYGATLSYKF